MKLLQRATPHWNGYEFPADIAELKQQLNAAGYDASDADIDWAWAQFSDSMAAGWMQLYDADENVGILLTYLQPAEVADE